MYCFENNTIIKLTVIVTSPLSESGMNLIVPSTPRVLNVAIPYTLSPDSHVTK